MRVLNMMKVFLTREANPENIMVACGVQRIDRPGKSPLDKHEVRLQVKEIIRHPEFSW